MSNADDICEGDFAKIKGPVKRTDINGAECRVIKWCESVGRWAVCVISTDEKVLVKTSRLVRCSIDVEKNRKQLIDAKTLH